MLRPPEPPSSVGNAGRQSIANRQRKGSGCWQDRDNFQNPPAPAAGRARPARRRPLRRLLAPPPREASCSTCSDFRTPKKLAYRALVEVPSYDAAGLAVRQSCHPVEAARSLAALQQLGLAARSSSGNDRYVASPPSVALAALAVHREEERRRAQRETDALTEVYSVSRDAGSFNDGGVQVGQGPFSVSASPPARWPSAKSLISRRRSDRSQATAS